MMFLDPQKILLARFASDKTSESSLPPAPPLGLSGCGMVLKLLRRRLSPDFRRSRRIHTTRCPSLRRKTTIYVHKHWHNAHSFFNSDHLFCCIHRCDSADQYGLLIIILYHPDHQHWHMRSTATGSDHECQWSCFGLQSFFGLISECEHKQIRSQLFVSFSWNEILMRDFLAQYRLKYMSTATAVAVCGCRSRFRC